MAMPAVSVLRCGAGKQRSGATKNPGLAHCRRTFNVAKYEEVQNAGSSVAHMQIYARSLVPGSCSSNAGHRG